VALNILGTVAFTILSTVALATLDASPLTILGAVVPTILGTVALTVLDAGALRATPTSVALISVAPIYTDVTNRALLNLALTICELGGATLRGGREKGLSAVF
jgi:hypothetical protein